MLLAIHGPYIGDVSQMPRKTEKLNICIDPVVKVAFQKAAEGEHGSIANMIEVVVEYAKKMEIVENHNKRKS